MKHYVYLLLLTMSALAHTIPKNIQAFLDQAKEDMQASAVVVVYDVNGSRFINDTDLARALRFEPERLLYPLWLSTVKSPDLIDDLTPHEVFETLKRYCIPYRYENGQAAYAYLQGYQLSLGLMQLVRIYGKLPYKTIYASKELTILQTDQNIHFHNWELLRFVEEYRFKKHRMHMRHAIDKPEYDRAVFPRTSVTIAKQGNIVVGVLVLHATFPIAGNRYESNYVAQTLLEMLGRVSQDNTNHSVASSIQ